ncbi:hypothetical protein ACLB2K_047020 [Fragaria x ananassa]
MTSRRRGSSHEARCLPGEARLLPGEATLLPGEARLLRAEDFAKKKDAQPACTPSPSLTPNSNLQAKTPQAIIKSLFFKPKFFPENPILKPRKRQSDSHHCGVPLALMPAHATSLFRL